jgi:hypothetical protein
MLFSTKNICRLMWLVIILLTFAAGFYKSALETEKTKYQILENKTIEMDF